MQVKVERAVLLGRKVTERLRMPGRDWPTVDTGHVANFAQKLADAGNALRAEAKARVPVRPSRLGLRSMTTIL